jgi:hypothetical protein
MSCLVFCSRCKYCNDIPAFPLEADIRLLFNVPSRCLVCNEQCHFIWKTASENIFLINALKFDNYLSRYEQEGNENIEFLYFISLIFQVNYFKQMYEDILTAVNYFKQMYEDTLTAEGLLPENETRNYLETNEQQNKPNTRNELETSELNSRNESNTSEPTDQTNSTAKVQKEDDDEECSICLGEYEKEEDIIKIRCSHIFHKTCLSEWEKNDNNTCPVCRTRYVFKSHTFLVILPDRIGIILDDS